MGWAGDSFCVTLSFTLTCSPCLVLMIPSTVSPRSKGQQGTRRDVGCTVAVTVGVVVVRARDLSLYPG